MIKHFRAKVRPGLPGTARVRHSGRTPSGAGGCHGDVVVLAPAWWRDLLGRIWRQLYQTAVPLLSMTDLPTDPGKVKALALAVAGAEAVTLVKFVALRLAGIQLTAAAPLWRRVTERAVAAAAGVVAGISAATTLTTLQAHAGEIAGQALLAAVIAVLDLLLNPPAAPVAPTQPALKDAPAAAA